MHFRWVRRDFGHVRRGLDRSIQAPVFFRHLRNALPLSTPELSPPPFNLSLAQSLPKMPPMKTHLACLLLATLMAAAAASRASEPTAFQLIKEANKHVGEDAKDKITQVRSEKSVGSLVPNIWYVVFYDRDATAKATEVKFAAGKKIAVKRPSRILELGAGSYKEIDRSKLKIDSNKVIETAMKEPLLANLTITNTQLWLERAGRDDDSPVWKIRLWAAKVRKPSDTVEIGDLYLSAEDGKVIKNNLKIQRVD
jgi:hypothetical protein